MALPLFRVRAVVRGAVQGVGFRYSAREEALRLGLSGFVRNDPDGTVVAEGEAARGDVERFTSWLAHGPEFARVDGVDVEEIATTGSEGFDLRH